MEEKYSNPLLVENVITKEKIFKSLPSDEEIFYDGKIMISETDTKGIITYTNRKFREMSGFTKEQLIGSPHRIVRHPDMPVGLFYGMWQTIRSGKIWNGYVKNMTKNGKYYWVNLYVQPKTDHNAKIIGYAANSQPARPEAIEEIKEIYAQLQGVEHMQEKFFLSSELIVS